MAKRKRLLNGQMRLAFAIALLRADIVEGGASNVLQTHLLEHMERRARSVFTNQGHGDAVGLF
jgi:hypothetical protein